MAPPTDVPGLGPEWSAEARAFVDHWRSLRAGALMPTSENFLDNPSPVFAPNSYIAEITEAGAIIRFQGTNLVDSWARDFTGQELHDGRSEEFKAKSLSNMRHVVSQPCGHLIRLSFSTSKGRKMSSDLILLPLVVKAGRAPRLIGFARRDSSRGYQETVARYLETHKMEWHDIGAGVPSAPPFDLMQGR